eukprot:351465-Chlamydomonas_euryale.AAC.8
MDAAVECAGGRCWESANYNRGVRPALFQSRPPTQRAAGWRQVYDRTLYLSRVVQHQRVGTRCLAARRARNTDHGVGCLARRMACWVAAPVATESAAVPRTLCQATSKLQAW